MKSIWILLLALAACGPAQRDPGEGDDDGNGSGSGSGSGTGEERQCNQMDIIFVVDDSGSMSEEQSNLGANFPMFASLLQSYTNADGDHIDFRVAVTTTGRDMDYSIDIDQGMTFPQHEDGDNGAFKNNCGSSKRYIDTTDTNMNQLLGCRANVGTSG